MKKLIVVLVVVFLTGMAAQAEVDDGMMGGGMMGGGMMGEGQGGESSAAQTAMPGAQIFSEYCESCHYDGGNVVSPDMPLKGSRMLADFKTFLDFIRNPRLPNGDKGVMPVFDQAKISDSQAAKLYQYASSKYGSGISGN